MWDVVEHAAEDVVVRELEKRTVETYIGQEAVSVSECRPNSRADVNEHLAEDKDDQGRTCRRAVQVVVRSVFSQCVTDRKQKRAKRVQPDQFPCFVAETLPDVEDGRDQICNGEEDR